VLKDAALVLRPIVTRPARLLASVLGVAVGVAAVVSTVAGSGAAVASFSSDVEVLAGPAVLEVRGPGGVALERLGALREVARDVHVVPVIEETAVASDGERVRVLGVDLFADRRFASDEPSLDDDGAAGERLERLLFGNGVLVPEALAQALGVASDGALVIGVRGRDVELDVVETFDPERAVSVFERTLLVDVTTAGVLFERGAFVDRVELVPRDGVDVDASALEARVEAALAAHTHEGESRLWADAPSARRAEGEKLVAALRFNLTALSGVSMLVGVALVATTLATSVVQRRDRLALLRSLGASRAQLAAGVLGEAALIGFLGGALGVALGALGARLAVDGVSAAAFTLAPHATASAVVFDPLWLPLGIGLGVGAALLAALLPLYEAVHVPPLQGLRSERPTRLSRRGHLVWTGITLALVSGAVVLLQLPPIDRRPMFALVACLVLLLASVSATPPLVDLVARARVGSNIALRLAQAALASSRGRAAWAAGAVAIAVGLAVAMATMVGSFRRTVTAWTHESLQADLYVRSPTFDGIDESLVEHARAVLGRDAVNVYRSAEARYEGERVILASACFEVAALHGTTPMLAGGDAREAARAVLERRGAVVNEPFARRFGVWSGETLELETAGGLLRVPIVGVAQEFAGAEGRVSIDESVWLALHPAPRAISLSLHLADGADVAAAQSAIEAGVAPGARIEVIEQQALFGEVMRIFDRTFGVTVALQILASIAAALAVVTVLGALVRERRFDLAVVRVVGAARGQLVALVLGEAFVLGLVGAGVGAVLGVTVGWVLVTIVNVQSHGWSLVFEPPLAPVVWTALAVVPACVLAGLAPALGALARAPREVLRETG
jgi:putative ABC transport system permease protein